MTNTFPKLRVATKQQIQEAQEYQARHPANRPHLGMYHIQTAEYQRQKENLKRKYVREFDLYEERKNVSQGINDEKIFYWYF